MRKITRRKCRNRRTAEFDIQERKRKSSAAERFLQNYL